MKPKTIPYGVLNALREREYTEEQIAAMSIRKAIAEYAAWHLGDPSWGCDFYDYIVKMQGDAS
jgi:hypothetical protein